MSPLSLIIFVTSSLLVQVKCGQRILDYSDAYNVPYTGSETSYQNSPNVVFASGVSGATLEQVSYNPDFDSLLDLQDQVIHRPIHGKILMPQMRHMVPTEQRRRPRHRHHSSGYRSGYRRPASYIVSAPSNAMHPETLEDTYVPGHRYSDTMIVMVDEPVIIVGPPPTAAATTPAAKTTAAATTVAATTAAVTTVAPTTAAAA